MDINQELERMWNNEYKDIYDTNSTLSSLELSPAGKNRFKVIHNSIRDYYERNSKSDSKKILETSKNCPLDDFERLKNKAVNFKNLFFRINVKPSLKNHLFVQGLNCTPYPTPIDHETIMDFVSITDYTVYQNLSGSGAGIPGHMHYQGQKREYFPLIMDNLDKGVPIIDNDLFSIFYPKTVQFSMMFIPKSDISHKVLSEKMILIGENMKKELSLSHNCFQGFLLCPVMI